MKINSQAWSMNRVNYTSPKETVNVLEQWGKAPTNRDTRSPKFNENIGPAEGKFLEENQRHLGGKQFPYQRRNLLANSSGTKNVEPFGSIVRAIKGDAVPPGKPRSCEP